MGTSPVAPATVEAARDGPPAVSWWSDDVLGALCVLLVAKAEQLLELDARRRLYQHVQQFPGTHLSEIARATGLDTNHAKYHLTTLEKHGLVSSRKDDGYWRFFPREEGTAGLRDTLSVDEKRVLALLRRPVPLHVVLVLLDAGETNHEQLRDKVGVAHGTLHYHLTRLESAGVLASEKVGRERRYRVVDRERVEGLLLRYRPPDALVKGFLEAWEQLEL